MALSPTDLAKAQEVMTSVQAWADRLKAKDGETGVDQDPADGQVSISREGLQAHGKPSVIVPAGGTYQDDLYEGTVEFNKATDKVTRSNVTTERYYMSGYGKSASDYYHYTMEPKTERDGFLGIFGAKHDKLVYTLQRDEYWNVHNSIDRVKVDATSGQVLSYQHKDYAQTFGSALKEVCTTPAGIGLLAVTGLLTSCPGTLPYMLCGGPWAGLVAVPAVACALAYYKTKAW